MLCCRYVVSFDVHINNKENEIDKGKIEEGIGGGYSWG